MFMTGVIGTEMRGAWYDCDHEMSYHAAIIALKLRGVLPLGGWAWGQFRMGSRIRELGGSKGYSIVD